MQTTVVIIAIGLLFLAAYGDLRNRRIPNALCLAVGVLGLVRIAFAGDAVAALYTIAAAAVVFTASLVLFWRGAVGGGDVKLVAAMALLIGYREVVGFLVLMSICGGVLALGTLVREMFRGRLVGVWRPARRSPSVGAAVGAMPTAKPTVPYGVAIAAAGVATLILAR